MNDQELEIARAKERTYEDSLADRYNRDYFDAPLMRLNSAEFVEYVNSYVKSGDRVLDLACGPATLWPHFMKMFPSDIHLVGCELSQKMVEFARKRFPTHEFREGNFHQIPFDSGSFDVVIVSSAFHHINDRFLPTALDEIYRVLDEHGVLIGREPLNTGRLVDRGGWLIGALMHLRHLAYRISGTREYPEPDPGPDHHAYNAKNFLEVINNKLKVVNAGFRNPVSLLLHRAQDLQIANIGKYLDENLRHRGGQEIIYAAQKNFSTLTDIQFCIKQAILENEISNVDLKDFMAHVQAAAESLDRRIETTPTKTWE